MPPMRLYIIN